MEKYLVKIEMVNGESHSYEIQSLSYDKVFDKLTDSSGGWIEIFHDQERHFVSIDKITRFTIISESDYNKRQADFNETMTRVFNL